MDGEASRATFEAMHRLISAWLHGQPLDLPGLDFEALARAAQRHSLSAAVCFALERTGLASRCPGETMERLRKAKLASIRKSMLMDAERARLLAFLEQAGIWYAPLKGIVLNGCYPELGAREFSDNDILFDAERWRAVRDFMKRRGYQAKEIGHGAHDAYWKPPLYSFEMHRVLFADDFRGGFLSACAAYYANPRRRLLKDAGNAFGYHFSDEDFYVHVAAHAFKHFHVDGTGIRALLDLYLYRARKPALDEACIARALEALGIAEYEARCRSLARKLFDFPSRLDELDEAERSLLDAMEGAGTYGTLERHVRSEMEFMRREGAVQDGARAKFRYVWRRLFPELRWYRTEAPLVYRHRWLLPFFWLYRLFRGVCRNGAKNLRMLKLALGASAGESGGEGRE